MALKSGTNYNETASIQGDLSSMGYVSNNYRIVAKLAKSLLMKFQSN